MTTNVSWLAAICLTFSSGVLAERRSLDPPRPVEFRLADHIAADYAAGIAALEKAVGCFDDPAPAGLAAVFRETLDQVRLLEAGGELATAAEDYWWNPECGRPEREARRALREAAEEVVRMVRAPRYLAHPLYVPLKFEVDEARRVYRVSWREWEGDVWTGGWTGPEEVREIPFVPEVVAFVEGTYESGAYGYRVSNDRRSGAPLSRKTIELEAVGMTEPLLRMRQDVSLRDRRREDGSGTLSFSLPSTVSGNYRVSLFDGSTPWFASTGPGEAYTLAPFFRVPWRSLPGMVRCWVRVAPWDPTTLGSGLDPEREAGNVMFMFPEYSMEPGPRGPRFAYTGKTIGPVPVPEPLERAEFVGRIGEYLREARYWGWCPDGELADRLEAELARVDPGAPDPEQIARLLQEVEAAAESGGLLHEAHVLLKYNLEYLADPSHWE
jgi:hypothetical protein